LDAVLDPDQGHLLAGVDVRDDALLEGHGLAGSGASAFFMRTQQRARWSGATSSRGGSSVRQRSTRNGHLGWNLHPGGGLVRSGGSPEIANSFSCSVASRRGIERRSDQVYGCWGSLKIWRVGPCSTMRPAYITTTRVQRLATTARLWVIRMIAVPSSRLRSRSSSMICASTVT